MVSDKAVKELTDLFADILSQAVGLKKSGKELEYLKTNRLIAVDQIPDIITFSGGVALCMQEEKEKYEFGDIGVFLAHSIIENKAFQRVIIEKSAETMRATVIGAGNYSMNISGSTIEYTENHFPIRIYQLERYSLQKKKISILLVKK